MNGNRKPRRYMASSGSGSNAATVRANPSLKRRANGMPSLAFILFWASAVLPLAPA